MKHAILSAVIAVAASVPVYGNDWTATVEKLAQSVVPITSEDSSGRGSCTGFVINEKENWVATMDHCRMERMFVDGIPATIVKHDTKRDLLVLHVPRLDKPALPLASDDPKVGDRVAAFGYGYGFETPMLREGTVGDTATDVESRGWPGPLVSVDIPFESGMSGGPVVNLKGEVVMMVKGGTDRRGVGPGAKIIKDRIGKYFEKRP